MMSNNNVTPLVVFVTITTVLGTALVALRLYCRAVILNSLKSDDWTLMAACLVGFAAYALVMVLALTQMRTAYSDGSKTDLELDFGYKNLTMISTVVVSMQNVLARISLLLSYRRITPETFRSMRMFLNFLLIGFPITALGFFILGVAPCWPPHFIVYGQEYLDLLESGKIKCIRASLINFMGTMYGLLGDAVVYVIPFLIIRMAKKRIGTYALFAFGGLVFLISLSRLPFILVFRHTNLSRVPISQIMIIWMFNFAESSGIMIVAAVPTLRPLFRSLQGWHCSKTDEEAVSSQNQLRPASKFSW